MFSGRTWSLWSILAVWMHLYLQCVLHNFLCSWDPGKDTGGDWEHVQARKWKSCFLKRPEDKENIKHCQFENHPISVALKRSSRNNHHTKSHLSKLPTNFQKTINGKRAECSLWMTSAGHYHCLLLPNRPSISFFSIFFLFIEVLWQW